MKHYWVLFLCLYVLSINTIPAEGKESLSPRKIFKLLDNKSERSALEAATMLFRYSGTLREWDCVGTIDACNSNDRDYIKQEIYLYVPSFTSSPIAAFGGLHMIVAALIIGTNDKNIIDLCRESLMPKQRDTLPTQELSVVMQKKKKNKSEKKSKIKELSS